MAQQQDNIKVSLWRKEAQSPIQAGDCVSFANVVVKKYKGETQLSSTSRTKIQVRSVYSQMYSYFMHVKSVDLLM